MPKYQIVEFKITAFIQPEFDSIEEAERFMNEYVDRLAEQDADAGIRWEEVDWQYEEID